MDISIYFLNGDKKPIDKTNYYDTSKMYTKLCSSYAWDTALKFIGGDYATNPTQGNYYGTTFSYKDITRAIQTKRSSTNEEDFSTLVPTGQATAVKNIYDMGGNVYEFTSESYSYENYPSVCCGGHYYSHPSDGPAGLRACNEDFF